MPAEVVLIRPIKPRKYSQIERGTRRIAAVPYKIKAVKMKYKRTKGPAKPHEARWLQRNDNWQNIKQGQKQPKEPVENQIRMSPPLRESYISQDFSQLPVVAGRAPIQLPTMDARRLPKAPNQEMEIGSIQRRECRCEMCLRLDGQGNQALAAIQRAQDPYAKYDEEYYGGNYSATTFTQEEMSKAKKYQGQSISKFKLLEESTNTATGQVYDSDGEMVASAKMESGWTGSIPQWVNQAGNGVQDTKKFTKNNHWHDAEIGVLMHLSDQIDGGSINVQNGSLKMVSEQTICPLCRACIQAFKQHYQLGKHQGSH